MLIGTNTISRFDSSVVEMLKKTFLQFSPRARSVSPISPVNRWICMLFTKRCIYVPLYQLQPQPRKQKNCQLIDDGYHDEIKSQSEAD